MNTISLDDARKLMKEVDALGNPAPFSLVAINCDLNRKTGGERITYSQAVLVNAGSNVIKVKGLGNNEVRSIHPLLITHINGKEVTI